MFSDSITQQQKNACQGPNSKKKKRTDPKIGIIGVTERIIQTKVENANQTLIHFFSLFFLKPVAPFIHKTSK